MKLQSGLKNFIGKIGILILLIILLFACTTGPEIPQKPTVKPTKTKASSAPSSPENNSPPTKTFSLQNANKVAPDDVLEEVAFGGRGGPSSCEDKEYNSPAVDERFTRDQEEWLAPIRIVTCGWWSDNEVVVTVELPDGNTLTNIEDVDHTNKTPYIHYEYFPDADNPAGNYHFSFSGSSGDTQYTVNVNIPNDTRIYYIEHIQSLYLYNFTPNEKVRLLLYDPTTGRLTAWDEYYVDNSGQLLIKIEPYDTYSYYDNYIAIGEKSGSVGNRIDVLASLISTSACPNALPSRLEEGKYAYVATDPPLDNRVREGAGKNYSIVGYIETGNAMKLLDGPKCANGWAWWKVQSIKKPDLVGWTAEGDDVYWLIPCETLDSCP